MRSSHLFIRQRFAVAGAAFGLAFTANLGAEALVFAQPDDPPI